MTTKKITLNELRDLVKQIIKEENDRNKPLTYKKITGYVGRVPVVAYVYPGSDSGLNHYRVDGKTKMGTVEFTEISKEEEIEY